ncbi:MAG TPA: hypothetical protein VFN23_20100 [Ktedonobacteraceae bacterium]|nr:hypothetical protein [Ktedonobacteraceae bacterium]
MDIYSHVMPTIHQDAMKKMNETFLEGDSEEEEDDDDDDAGGVLVPV